MKITFLGTGSPLPDANRAGPATLVQAGGLNLLFDCGRGVLIRLAAAGIPTPALVHLQLLTHLHSDHVTDLDDVMTTRWITSPVPSALPLVGPPGTRALLAHILELLAVDIGYRRGHHADLNWDPAAEVTELIDGEVVYPLLDGAGVRIVAAPTDHRPVAPTIGYRIEHEGRAVVIAGDTVPCEGLDRLVKGADLYVQTVVRDEVIRQFPMARLQEVLEYHSTVTQAAETASRGGVGTLALTHMVPTPAPGTEAEWIAIAAEAFDGVILAPDDLAMVEL